MYGIKLPKIIPADVLAYIADSLDPEELHPFSDFQTNRIARSVLPLVPNANTYDGGEFRQAVDLIYEFLNIKTEPGHPCRKALNPDKEAVAAMRWADEQIDKNM